MRSKSLLVAFAALVVAFVSFQPQLTAQAQKGPHVIQNENLALTLDEQTGMFAVFDKKANARWLQFSDKQPTGDRKPNDLLRIRKAEAGITVDSDLAEWGGVTPIRITADMLADAKAVSGNDDLSALVYLMWDDNCVYLAAKVVDDMLVFRDTSSAERVLKWWERDSVEMWIGPNQVGFALNPRKSLVVTTREELSDCQVAVREAQGGGGYVMEAAIPIRHFAELSGKAEVGKEITVAIGVNDADATGSREGQIYFPRTWRHSKVETFAAAVLADAKGELSREQMQEATGGGAIRNITPLNAPHPGLSFEADIDSGRGAKITCTVRIMVPETGSDVRVEIEGPNDAEIGTIAYPLPLVPETGDSWMALSPYGDGLLLRLRADELPRKGWRSDMAFFGVTNIERGYGYACIFDTPDDSAITTNPMSKAPDARMAVGAGWLPSMGKWGYTRKVIYRFCPAGSYVALAKAYRQYAQEAGILKPLREKMKRRPDIAKLMGAPDIWGANGLKWCQEAKSAGMDRLLVNGSWGEKATEEIKKLGYLVSVYDNYEDIMAGRPGHVGDCKIPDDAPLMANGNRMLGWPVHETDPKTGRTRIDPDTGKPFIKEQFYKRCSALDLSVAQKWIPLDQEKNPRNARFLDVTTATSLRECCDPNHYCTRAIDREHKQRLAQYVSEGLGLVLGGEHGTWWGAPYYDYWEGMQSGGFYSWPAGHVGMDLPLSREEIGEEYLKYGVGHYHRIPFWELVFGDCVVSYWYWGDSTGHLYNVAPEISYKKDLFNMLYGTLPLYWVSRPFGFNWSKPELRERLLESYRNTCKLHEQIGLDEMLSHEWLTDDRTVQKASFSSGTFVVANFGDATYDLKDEDKTYTLSPLGFFAKGPTILQYRIRKDGRDVTYIKTPDYLFADGGGKPFDFGVVAVAEPITIRTIEPDRLGVIRTTAAEPATVRPAQLRPGGAGWDVASTHVFMLNDLGERTEETPVEVKDGDILLSGAGAFEMVCGKRHDLPSLALDSADISIQPEHPKQGDQITIRAAIRNKSKAKAEDVPIAFYLEARGPGNLIGTRRVPIEGGGSVSVDCSLDTAALDGDREIIAAVDPENQVAELLENDNVGEKMVAIAPDYSRWQYRLNVEVANGDVEQEDVPVVLAVDFGKELKRLGGAGALDVNSIRVCERNTDGAPGPLLPCQFDPARDFDAGKNPVGEAVFLIPGKLPAHATKACLILFDVEEHGKKTGFFRKVWNAETTTASTEAYTAVFRDGCIVELYDKLGEERGRSLVTSMIYSSGQTGWGNEEEGVIQAVEVLANGPLRAVVKINKQLRAGLVYEKRYSFYPKRFDVRFQANKAYGTISRAYYALGGEYEDSHGNRAAVDGSGNGENAMGKCPDPKYYVVYAPGWAHSCVALTGFSNMTYWDSSSWGGIGFSGGDVSGAGMSYVMHPGQGDGAFGRADYERLNNPPKARIVP